MKATSKQFLLPLAKAIRERREHLGLSQESLAELCGFDRTYISMLERGIRNPSLQSLLKVASGLDVTISTLLAVYTNSNLGGEL